MNLDIKMNSDEIRCTETHLANILRARQAASGDGAIKIRRDEAFKENPMERKDYEDTIKVEDIKDMDAVYEFCRETCGVELVVVRIPLQEDQVSCDWSDDHTILSSDWSRCPPSTLTPSWSP